MAVVCSICQINQVKLPIATTCSLDCACRLNGDDYNAVAARLSAEVARMMAPCKRRSRAKA